MKCLSLEDNSYVIEELKLRVEGRLFITVFHFIHERSKYSFRIAYRYCVTHEICEGVIVLSSVFD